MPGATLWLRAVALVPLPLLAASLLVGAEWGFVALFYLTIFAFLIDESLMAGTVIKPLGRLESQLIDLVPVLLALAHLVLMPLAVLVLAKTDLGALQWGVVFAAFALFFGTIGTANAHELIHRPGLFRRALGKWAFISLLFGHHVSAHLSVHHRYAATPLDPNSARLNEGFYRFFHRAWWGSYFAGYKVEATRQIRNKRPRNSARNPYFFYHFGAATFLALAFVLAGWKGLAIYLGLAFLCQVQLLLSDYVQHYGLTRAMDEAGRFEPVSLRHSWNAPHAFTSAMMMNAPLHSDHHAHPSVPYAKLRARASEGAPVLPYSIPVMSCIALWPRWWRQVMNPRVACWRAQDSAEQRISAD